MRSRCYCFASGDYSRVCNDLTRAQREVDDLKAGRLNLDDQRVRFESWFSDTRRARGALAVERLLTRHIDGGYADGDTQRQWWTWQCALSGGAALVARSAQHAQFAAEVR